MSKPNTKQCQVARRDGPIKGGSRGQSHGNYNGDRGNRLFVNSSFAENQKTIAFPILQSPKAGLDRIRSRRFLTRYPTFVKTTMIISMILLVLTPSQHKIISCPVA